MYLKRLELHGFKSFHEKTVLDLGPGVTAVVGPNGSGKSNIADAIRWVLGEQSAKSLRGQKMEDVIFSGTANRRGVALAEVTLTLDNTDGAVTLYGGRGEADASPSEISVTRRVFRSGEGQYAINGVNTRLKDVHELFMDTGLGREGYSLIGQGRVEDILSVKSEERRAIFEEAAGIVKYKSRRTEAESRLERERQNYQRVFDIMTEIEGQLEPLREMSEKAKRYLELNERLKLVRVNAFVAVLSGQKEQELEIQSNINDITAQIDTAAADRASKKSAALSAREALSELSRKIDLRHGDDAQINLDIQKNENDIKLANMNIEHIDSQNERLKAEAARKKEAARAAEAEKLMWLDRLAKLAEEMLEREEEATGLKTLLEEQTRSLSVKEGDIERFNALHIERLRGESDIKLVIERLCATSAGLEERKDILLKEIAEAGTFLAEQEKVRDKASEELMRNADELTAATGDVSSFAENKDKLNGEYESLKKEHREETAKLNEAISRKKLLEELEAGYEGYNYSVKNLMTAAKSGKAGLFGLKGAVGELIAVPPQYETCVEAALGGAIMDIVTDDEDAAKAAIAYLKSSKKGRATFLPLSAIKPRSVNINKDALAREPGILGVASDFISRDKAYDNIILYLLGNVVVAEDIDAAVSFSKKHRYSHKVATLDGEIINPGGAITGGYTGKSAGLLSRRREIKELFAKIEVWESSAVKRNKLLDQTNANLSSASALLDKARMRCHELQINRAALESALTQGKKSARDALYRIGSLKAQNDDLSSQLEAINTELHSHREKHRVIETGISGLLTEINLMQESFRVFKKKRDETLLLLSGAESELSRLSEAIPSAEENAARADAAISDARNAALSISNELEALTAEKEVKLSLIDKLNCLTQDLLRRKKETEYGLSELIKERAAAESRLEDMVQDELEAVRLESRLAMELERQNSRREQAAADRSRLCDEMWEEYNVTPRSALTYERLDISPLRLRQEEASLKNELKAMGGSVNVGAAEEYLLIRERHGFLTKQLNDISQAEDKLVTVIAELNSLMDARFREQLEIISDNFGIVFKEVFGGGTAMLKLSDESDALRSGIEIVARPPGKSLQSMGLLSGGERALCAIALLFGILRLKPSPFCVLDEIETALDDANVRRFANFIKHYSGGTQFIVITHRKGTMEAADTLYGVTMQEAGVSKLVGVKFTEEEL